MAVDVYSENFISMNSPSFSFSNDLKQNDYNPFRLDHSVVDSPFDFAFNVDNTVVVQSSSADELFSNGKILPTSVKKVRECEDILVMPCLESESDLRVESGKKSLKEFLEDNSEEEDLDAGFIKTFWKFKRSNSLNCDRSHKKSLIGSWKILSRSGSTGEFLEKILEENEKKPGSNSNNIPGFFSLFSRSNSLTGNVTAKKSVNLSSEVLRRSNSTSDYYVKSNPKPIRRSNSTGSAPNNVGNKKKNSQQEHFVGKNEKVKGGKKCGFGDYYSNNNGKVNPILNLPSPYISRVSVDLFGIGSLFCNGSSKYRKKKK